jgi:hypothetical protein
MPAQARPDPAGDRLWIVIDGRCGNVYGLQGNASGDGKATRPEPR